MSHDTDRISGLWVTGAYFFLFTLFMWPLVDLLSNAWPLQPGNIQWRFGFMGLMTAYLHTPLLALALLMGLGFARGHKKTLRLLSLLLLTGAFLLILVMGLFALDAIQLRSVTPEENLGAFHAGSILSELKFFTAMASAGLLGWGGWKTAGNLGGKGRSRESSDLTAEVLKAQKRD
jgi:hypothetical protein